MKTNLNLAGCRAAGNIVLLLSLAAISIAQAAEPVVQLKGHIPTAVKSAALQASDPQAANQSITITVMLNLSDQAGFQAYETGLSDPTSPDYGHPLGAADFTARFGPTQDAYNSVMTYLQQNGFRLVEGSNNRRAITVSGTRAQAEAAFHTTLGDYELSGRSFHAPLQEPSLPASIAPLVAAISGLSNGAQWHTAGVALPPFISSAVGTGYNGTTTPAGSANAGGLPPGLTGSGQYIALVELDNYEKADLTSTLKQEGLSSHINQVTEYAAAGGTGVSGCKATQNGCGTTEALLDISAVLGIAPDVNVAVFYGPSGSFLQIVNDAIDGMTAGGYHGGVISISAGTCESWITSADAYSLDSLLETNATTGLTVFAATGDTGSTCAGELPNVIPYPADVPHVVAVGGTALEVNLPSNTYNNETLWSGSGFGVSTIFIDQPSYQAKLYSASGRSIPDVVAYASPGVNICQANSTTSTDPTGCFFEGGTSLATPLWAGVWALANQAQTDACGADGAKSAALNGYLYTFNGTNAFHSASSMGSNFAHAGLGSPDILSLVSRSTCGDNHVSSIKPSTGSGSGGTTVTLEGTNFIGVTGVSFGSANATKVTVYSDTKLTAESPAAASSVVFVSVATSEVPSEIDLLEFSYTPVIKAVTPSIGPFYGGTKVTVTGYALSDSDTFKFDGNPATSVSCSSSGTSCTMVTPAFPTQVTCTGSLVDPCKIPPPPGLVGVEADSSVGNSPSVNLFTYQPLAITSYAPTAGPTAGGRSIQIWGTSLKEGMTVNFGPYTATVSSCYESETCVVNNPPAKTLTSTGPVPLSVTVDGITSAAATPDFLYVDYPTVTQVIPSSIPANNSSQAETVQLQFIGTGFTSTGTEFIAQVTNGPGFTNVSCSSTSCTANLTIPANATVMATDPIAVEVGGYTSTDTVNLTFPSAPTKPIIPCKGATCAQ